MKSLYPLGQPEKALGHEPQIDLCVAYPATDRLASFRKRSRRRYSITMQRSRNHAKPAPGPESRKPEPSGAHNAQGLEVAESLSPSSRGRKMSLTSPLIDQAFSQACAVCSPFPAILSAIGMFRQPTTGCLQKGSILVLTNELKFTVADAHVSKLRVVECNCS